MPEKIVKDVGMMQREAVRYDTTHAAGEAEWNAAAAALKAWGEQPMGDARIEHNAKLFRAIMASGGLADLMENTCAVDTGKLRAKGFSEDSEYWIAAHWLGAFNRLRNERTRLVARQGTENTLSLIVEHAQEMGRLQERLFWRAGVDPQTGKRREKLAIGKRAQQLAIPKATEARRVQAQDTRPDWHDNAILNAEEIRKAHPSYSRWRIAGEIHALHGVSRGRCDKVLRENGMA